MNFKFSCGELERLTKTDSAKPGDVAALAQIALGVLSVRPVGRVFTDEPLLPGDEPFSYGCDALTLFSKFEHGLQNIALSLRLICQ
ncbi:hypothetical protein [Erwinia sp. 198]|uniref:hypothetical protein n=1 Tax=Erwinia sp. 198 TaxID=2022746 RepID=UPI000F661913|nr:hypothetical protein [Erwinia sp. 198]RRZ95630.1 hypothetical protein EGK14_03485 [Erwinia sp. 198]